MQSLRPAHQARRIAVLVEYPTVHGGENSLLAALKHLLESNRQHRSFDFCVMGPAAGAMEDRVASLGIPFVELTLFDAQGHRLPRERCVVHVLDAVTKFGADLIHGNSLSMGRLLGAASRQDSGLVSTAHLRDIMKLSRSAIADLNANRKLIAVSLATLQFHIQQGLDEHSVSVIHNGIDADHFSADPAEGTRIREELGIARDATVLLTVGQIGLRKGLDTLTEVARRLAGTRRRIHWLLAGERFSQKAESVEYEARVLDSFSTYEPNLQLHPLGYRHDIPSLMQAADVLVHAARQEPLGRVLLEAAASNLPIVATDVGGTSEILTHRMTAMLVPADSPQPMAAAVSELIGDPNLRKSLATAAGKSVRTHFRIAESAEKLAGVWHSVLAESGR